MFPQEVYLTKTNPDKNKTSQIDANQAVPKYKHAKKANWAVTTLGDLNPPAAIITQW